MKHDSRDGEIGIGAELVGSQDVCVDYVLDTVGPIEQVCVVANLDLTHCCKYSMEH